MAYNRFLLNQLLPAGNGKTIYELILDEPYSAGRKPSDAADSLAAKTPADVAVGSKATYITEDANGNRIVWEFTYQQTAVDETGWVITKVLEGGMAPIPLEVTENAKYEGNGATAYTPVDVDVPNPSTGTLQITENGEGIDVSSYAYADVNVSGGGSSDFSTATLVIDTAQAHSGGFYLPVIDDSDDDPMIYLVNEGCNAAEHTTPNVVLYRGACYTSIESDSNLIVATTGNVEADGEGGVWYLYITGDGTITVADGE